MANDPSGDHQSWREKIARPFIRTTRWIRTRIFSKGSKYFLEAVLLKLTFPLLPLGIEYYLIRVFTIRTLVITGAIYTISIGASSRWRSVLYLSLIFGILNAVAFGTVVSGNTVPANTRELATYTLIGIFTIHFIERFHRHYKLLESVR